MPISRLSFGEHEEMEQETEAKWLDDDDLLDISSRNRFKKLQLEEEASQKKYEGRLQQFYNSRYGVSNWAVEGEGEYEEDFKDMMNQEEIYANKDKDRYGGVEVEFLGRTTEKHNSVVTGLDYRGRVAASCGNDSKLKLWSIKNDESNPELRIKLEKDVYTEGYPLSNCYFRGEEVLMGTLRQNLIAIDCEKWKINRISSSFLNHHKKFNNLRISPDKTHSLLFS